ncbi:MAG: hypothetical protein AAGG11_18025 [Pseudomonadota bacterium]
MIRGALIARERSRCQRKAGCGCTHRRLAKLSWRSYATCSGHSDALPNAVNERLSATPLTDPLAATILDRVYKTPGQAISVEQLQLELSLRYPLAVLAPERTESTVRSLAERGLVLLLAPARSEPGLTAATETFPANDALYLSALPA